MENVIHIPPNKFIHILDKNSNLKRLEVGPSTFIRKEHEELVSGKLFDMITLPPRNYCIIENPVIKDKNGSPVLTPFGEVKLAWGEREIRFNETHPDPFPLYPGEELFSAVQQVQFIKQNSYARFKALRDFTDENGTKRFAGSIYNKPGPFTLVPRIEEELQKIKNAKIVLPNTGVIIEALQNLKDRKGVDRLAGEIWLVRDQGAYIPLEGERVKEMVQGIIITEKNCLMLRGRKKFKDVYGKIRNPGERWLITSDISQLHIPDVYEEVLAKPDAITLNSRQYCFILNPVDKEGQNQWGKRLLVKGEKTFFLNPGEVLENNKLEKIEILDEDQALLLAAQQDFVEDNKTKRVAGEKWLIKGPREYIPPVEATILEKRKAIPLDENEGIYVRDNRTGEVKTIKGQTYMLQAHETLWEKELSQEQEDLLNMTESGIYYNQPKKDVNGKYYSEKLVNPKIKRIKSNIVRFKAPHNSAVQIFDYKEKSHRIVFGPEMVLLGPHENITVLSLSGGKPKVEGLNKALQLNLGPDISTDIVIVETSDHARLSLQLAYQWYFKVDKQNKEEAAKIFTVKDFVGDICKKLASRIRGAVSSITFEDFHHHSSIKIREAVFGKNKDGSIKEEMHLTSNLLCINGIDIQNIEITDPTTREHLTRSINMAIEIATKSQEAASRQQAERMEHESQGMLERQILEDKAKAEEANIKLLELQAESTAVLSMGKALATAKAKAEADKIKAEAQLRQAELKAQALKIELDAKLDELDREQKADIEHSKALYELNIKKERDMSEIEVKKFKQIVGALGKETLVAISKAGPEMKAKLLSGLGLKGYLVTDGRNPINLFNTANGLIADVPKNFPGVY